MRHGCNKGQNRLSQLNLTKNLNVSKVGAQLMSPIAERESTLFDVLLQFAPVDILGQAVGHVVPSLHCDKGELSSSDLLLPPQLSHLNMSNSHSASP